MSTETTVKPEEVEIADAELVEPSEPTLVAAVGAAPPPGGREIVRRERRSEVLRPLDVDTVLEGFEDYQRLVQRLLTPDDWQGKPGADGSFVKKKGWRKIATAFDLDLKRVSASVERDEHGNALRAAACYVAIAPSGRSMDGDGYCSADEPRFAKEKGRQKLENDLQATATTRAKNRAISDLVGMGAVSAEEVDTPSRESPTLVGPPFGIPASDQFLKQTRAAIAFLFTSDEETCEPDDSRVTAALTRAIDLLNKQGLGGDPYIPFATAVGIAAVATELKVSWEATYGGAAESTTPVAAVPAATSEAPKVPNIAGMSGEAGTDALKAAGCVCPDPLGVESGTVVFDDACPMPGHGVPF